MGAEIKGSGYRVGEREGGEGKHSVPGRSLPACLQHGVVGRCRARWVGIRVAMELFGTRSKSPSPGPRLFDESLVTRAGL